ncbi:hypothetical protein LTS15_007045 [Exophiala xenobiotica]|nr:hypothetical protein LTS15_007045 [Exophiala xenobiotica]
MPHPGMDELPDQDFAKLSSLHLPTNIAEKDPYDFTTISEFRSSKRTWTPLGSVATWPPQELPQPNLDWSLISIEDDEALLPNTDVSNPGPQSSDCLRVFEGRPADLTKERPVFLLDARMKRRRGILQPTPSYIFLPQVDYGGNLHAKGTHQGDCGLWVVDQLSYEVYGQIVAMDHFAEIYVVPLHQIQSQISTVLGGSAVNLPGSTSVSTERQRRRTRKHQLAETKAFTEKHAARGLSCLIGDPSVFEHYAGHDSMQTMELPKPLEDMSTTMLSPPGLPQDTIHWLKTPSRNSNPEDGSMKMLLISTLDQSSVKKSLSSAPVPVGTLGRGHHDPERNQQRQFVLAILNGMSLPLASLASYIKGHTTFVCIPPDTTSGADPGFAFYMSNVNFTIVWWYSPVLRHTAAVVFHQGRLSAGASFRAQFVRDLLGHQSYLTHPILPGYIYTRVCLSTTFDMLDDCNHEAFNLGLAAGMPNCDFGLRRIHSDNVSMDLGEKAHALSGKLTDIRFRLRTYQQQIKFMSRCNSGHRQSLNMGSRDFLQSDQLQTHLDVMWDYAVVHLYDADSLVERLQTVLSSICRATTYRESRATLALVDTTNEIACHSRSDTSAIRTITVLTLLFLAWNFRFELLVQRQFPFLGAIRSTSDRCFPTICNLLGTNCDLECAYGWYMAGILKGLAARGREILRLGEETGQRQCVEAQSAVLQYAQQDIFGKYKGEGARQRTPFSTIRDKFQVVSHPGARSSDWNA